MKKICDINNSVEELLTIINIQPSGFAFITDNDKLISLATDGDIRRALLSGIKLENNISSMNLKMCEFAFADEKYDSIISKLSEKIRILPIVNNDLEVVDFMQFDKRSYIPVAQPNLKGNELKYVTDALLSTWISSTGKYIDKFEQEFSNYIKMKYGVATSNGTTALHLALMALDIKENDEVIIPDLTFAATINAVLHANAIPVIVDVDEDSWCINPKEIEKAITYKSKAIIPVHLYGQSCDMDTIMDIAKKYNLKVIEDCAEAHGAKFNGKKVGSFGDVSCFSFFGNKIITTGEGGMCLTDSVEINDKLRQLRDHGMSKKRKYWHDMIGYNYRMTNIQAAIGCAQLERIDEILWIRQDIENKYLDIFSKYNYITVQKKFPNIKKVSWLVSAILNNKDMDRFIQHFKSNNIDIRNFFYPLSEMDIYKQYTFGINLIAKKLSKIGINFPTHSDVDFKRIDESFKSFN